MKILNLIVAAVFSSVFGFAQQGYQSYVDGSPATLIKKIDVEGSEFLYDKWLPTTIKNTKGVEYKGVMVKYNLLEDVPYFLGKADQAMSFSVSLAEFIIQKENGELQKFKAGFPSIDKYNELTFYEVLVDGNAKLLKKNIKKITENREYNSATTVKRIVDNVGYFVFEGSKISVIKKENKSILAAVSKKEQMQKYLFEKRISIKKEEDLIDIFQSYNKF